MNREIVGTIRRSFEHHGYQFFNNGQYNLNIFAVRSQNPRVNRFDDAIFCVYKDYLDNWRIHQWECTTDPGLFYMKNPINSKGTGALVPGQYLGVYKIDKHSGKYDALCQRNGNVRVFRDNNKDSILDLDIDTIEEGRFGVNIHHAGNDSQLVDRWSAACTVFKRKGDFRDFMRICYKSKRKYGNSFTYTLFQE